MKPHCECIGAYTLYGAVHQLYLRKRLILFLPPLPPGGPGEGPDCHFPMEIEGFGTIPARIRGGESLFFIFVLAGYLKEVWPDFRGAFLRSGQPRGPGKASPPTFLRAFPGPRGRPDIKIAPRKISAVFHVIGLLPGYLKAVWPKFGKRQTFC